MEEHRKEKLFLLNCLLELAQPDRFDTQSSADLDWDWIFHFAFYNRVLGFVGSVLEKKKILETLGKEGRYKIFFAIQSDLRNNEIRRSEFIELSSMLNVHSISVIPLKGIALSYLVYDKLPCRQMVDLDILVQKEDVERVLKILVENEFDPNKGRTRNRWHDEMNKDRVISHALALQANSLGRFAMSNGRYQVDVHYDPIYAKVKMDLERVWKRSTAYPSISPNVRMLDPVDQFFHVLIHTAHSPSIRGLLDLLMMMSKYRLDPSQIAADKDASNIHWKKSENLLRSVLQLLDVADADHLPDHLLNNLDIFFEMTQTNDMSSTPDLGRLRRIRSVKDFFLYFLGYIVPNPYFYNRRKGRWAMYKQHWKSLYFRFCALFLKKAKK